MNPPETADIDSGSRLPSGRVSYIWRVARPGKGEAVPADDRGKWFVVGAAARRMAAVGIPLLLGAAAMALLLDSGRASLPTVGVSSASPPPEKVVVSPRTAAQAHHRSVARHAAPAGRVTPYVADASSTPAGSASRQSTGIAAAEPTPKPSRNAKSTGTPSPVPAPAVLEPAGPPGRALGHLKPKPARRGRALGHLKQKFTPPGHLHHTPPGLARKAGPQRSRHDRGRGHGAGEHSPHGRGR